MKKVILLAEDSVDDIAYLRRGLEAARVTNPIHVVSDGRQVFEYLKGEGAYADRNLFPFPRVLFLDMLMPGIDGWKVMEWLQMRPQLLDQLLVVILTGAVQRHRLQEAYMLGANTFLLKPVKLEDLQHLIRYWPSAWDIAPAIPPRESTGLQGFIPDGTAD